ncbi:transposase [Mycobacterium colombiense]
MTQHRTREGWLYCCAVLDAFSRRIFGWSIDSRADSTLVVNALGMAIRNRRPEPGGIVHADHGTQFRSRKFVRALGRHGMVGSMCRVAAAGDSAAMESFFSLLQRMFWTVAAATPESS